MQPHQPPSHDHQNETGSDAKKAEGSSWQEQPATQRQGESPLQAASLPTPESSKEITEQTTDRSKSIAIGQALVGLSRALKQSREEFREYDKNFKASTAAMTGPVLELGAWFIGGLAGTMAVHQFGLPVTPEAPLYGALAAGAARFLYRLAKEARPTGIATREAQERMYAAQGRKNSLAKNASGMMGTPINSPYIDEEEMAQLLRDTLEYITPEVPYLQMNRGQMANKVVECGERLAHLTAPRNKELRERLEGIAEGYHFDRANLFEAAGNLLIDPEKNRAGVVVQALLRLSDRVSELDGAVGK